MTTIAVIAKLTAAEGKDEELEAVIEELVRDVSAGEPGTAIYAAHRDSSEPGAFWFYELYGSAEDATAHSDGKALQTAGAKMAGLLGGRPEIHRLVPFAAHGLPT